jgi:hypothetical protein
VATLVRRPMARCHIATCDMTSDPPPLLLYFGNLLKNQLIKTIFWQQFHWKKNDSSKLQIKYIVSYVNENT